MFGIFPFGVPFFAQPQYGYILLVTTILNTPTPEIKNNPIRRPMLMRTANDKPRIKN